MHMGCPGGSPGSLHSISAERQSRRLHLTRNWRRRDSPGGRDSLPTHVIAFQRAHDEVHVNRIPATLMLLLATLALAAGCMNNGVEWSELDFTRTKPRLEDLVGTWVPTESTLNDMWKRGDYMI